MKRVDPTNLDTIYTALEENCRGSGTAIVFDREMWLGVASTV